MQVSTLVFLTFFLCLAEAAILPVYLPETAEFMAKVAAFSYPGILASAMLTQTWRTRI